MKFIILFVLTFSAFTCFAQDSEPTLRQYPAIGSDKDQVSEQPAMYPAAKAEQQPQAPSIGPMADPTALPMASGTDSNLGWGLLAFTFLVLCVEAVVIVKAQKSWSPQSILRVFGLTLIIPMSAFLIVAGYSENQIAPAFGLLGVIAGYLLGNNDKSRAST